MPLLRCARDRAGATGARASSSSSFSCRRQAIARVRLTREMSHIRTLSTLCAVCAKVRVDDVICDARARVRAL
jgi:hypothetical protein